MPVTPRPGALVVMGVSATGKSSVGRALAEGLGWQFVEGDDLHPAGNVAKMARGEPLTDLDRAPWLAQVAEALAHHQESGTHLVVTCSALRRAYRDRLRSGDPSAIFVHLVAPREVLESRIRKRKGHFMPASLLDDQLATLEGLEGDEQGMTVDVSGPITSIVEEIRLRLPGTPA